MGTDLTGWAEIQPFHASAHQIPRDIRSGITWSEIAVIDWEKPAEAVDSMPHAYVRGAAA